MKPASGLGHERAVDEPARGEHEAELVREEQSDLVTADAEREPQCNGGDNDEPRCDTDLSGFARPRSNVCFSRRVRSLVIGSS